MTVNINFPVFVVYVMTFIGWFFLAFFLPTGFWAIPFDLIAGWAKRPKIMSDKDFSTAKSSLGADIGRLIDQGKRVNEEKEKGYRKNSPCERYTARVKAMSDQHLFETNCIVAEKQYKRLEMISQYRDKVTPCKYNGMLILGLFSFALSVLFMVHIFMYAALRVENKNVQQFLNNVVDKLYPTNGCWLGLLIMVLTCGYFLGAALKGNQKFGMRFFFMNFYPVVPGETFSNNFFASCLNMNMWMFALT